MASLFAGADVFVTTWSNRGVPAQTITVCRATDSPAHPYQPSTVLIAANGSLPQDVDPGRDVVPPYSYSGRNYPGVNWSPEGQALWYAGCKAAGNSLVLSQASPPATASVAPQPATLAAPFGLRPTARLVEAAIRVAATYVMLVGLLMIGAGALRFSPSPDRPYLRVSSDLSRYAKPRARPRAPGK